MKHFFKEKNMRPDNATRLSVIQMIYHLIFCFVYLRITSNYSRDKATQKCVFYCICSMLIVCLFLTSTVSAWNQEVPDYSGKWIKYHETDYFNRYPVWADDSFQEPVSEDSGNTFLSVTGVNVKINNLENGNFPDVDLFVTVEDQNGTFDSGLGAGNFLLKENNVVISPLAVAPAVSNAALSIGLTIDKSGSMGSSGIASAQSAVKDLIDMSTGAKDEFGIVVFNSKVTALQDFTTDKQALKDAVDSISDRGGTALYQAILDTLELTKLQPGVKAVIAFTDGENTDSPKGDTGVQMVIDSANQYKIPVYTIGIGSVEESALTKIADQTGGIYSPASFDNLSQIFTDLQQTITQQYQLSFTSLSGLCNDREYDLEVTLSTGAIYTDSLSDAANISCNPPIITLTTDTENMTLKGGAPAYGTPLEIKTLVTDPDGDTISNVNLYYRILSSNDPNSGYSYEKLPMSSAMSTSTALYSVTIPGSDYADPGMEFFITASDGSYTNTSSMYKITTSYQTLNSYNIVLIHGLNSSVNSWNTIAPEIVESINQQDNQYVEIAIEHQIHDGALCYNGPPPTVNGRSYPDEGWIDCNILAGVKGGSGTINDGQPHFSSIGTMASLNPAIIYGLAKNQFDIANIWWKLNSADPNSAINDPFMKQGFQNYRVFAINFSNNIQLTFEAQGYQLKAAIDEIKDITGVSEFVLIGHSMGGLAARAYIQNEQTANIKGLITIDTPHSGGKPIGSLGAGGNTNRGNAQMNLHSDSKDMTNLNSGATIEKYKDIKIYHLGYAEKLSKGDLLPFAKDADDGIVYLSSQMGLDVFKETATRVVFSPTTPKNQLPLILQYENSDGAMKNFHELVSVQNYNFLGAHNAVLEDDTIIEYLVNLLSVFNASIPDNTNTTSVIKSNLSLNLPNIVVGNESYCVLLVPCGNDDSTYYWCLSDATLNSSTGQFNSFSEENSVRLNAGSNAITLNPDLSFQILDVYQDTQIWANFNFYGEQNGQLVWYLADLGTESPPQTPDNSDTCGAYVAPGVWKAFDCYNLAAIGKTTNDDPFTPSWRLIGGYWQWGRKGPDSSQWHDTNTPHFAHGPTGPGDSEANIGSISGWEDSNYAPDGAWSESYKTSNDPCPDGFRVPTITQWKAVIDNNTQSDVGTWSKNTTNYSAARFFGSALMLPAAGARSIYSGVLFYHGNYSYYWSSSEYSGTDGAWSLYLYSYSGSANTYNSRRLGYSVRCVAE